MKFFGLLENGLMPSPALVEVSSSLSLPGIHIVGLPSREVGEARERIRSAIKSQGFRLAPHKFIINLVPAGIQKNGTGFDLAMALALLHHQWEAESDRNDRMEGATVLALGELGLEGELRQTCSLLRAVASAHQNQITHVLLAKGASGALYRQEELALLQGIPSLKVAEVGNLIEAWRSLENLKNKKTDFWKSTLSLSENKIPEKESPKPHPQQSTVSHAKIFSSSQTNKIQKTLSSDFLLPLPYRIQRAVLASIVGSHHLLLVGPAGSGKSTTFHWLEALCPELNDESKLYRLLLSEWKTASGIGSQNSKEHSVSPFPSVLALAPQVKPSQLLGGMAQGALIPGLISAGYGGFIFADEFGEWHRDSRECIRMPLERQEVLLQRGRESQIVPCDFTFVATANLCPCGNYHPGRLQDCVCGTAISKKYRQRLSFALLDRMGIVALTDSLKSLHEKKRVKTKPLSCSETNEIRQRIHRAKSSLIENWGSVPGKWNSEKLESIVAQTHIPDSSSLIASFRSRSQWIKLAFTLCALDEKKFPEPSHWSEALSYRPETLGLF